MNPVTTSPLFRVCFKALLLFILLNMLYVWLEPLEAIGKLSLYNILVPGRSRLPYGEDSRSYNLSPNSLSALFASHEIAQAKAEGEFRVVFLGDSSTWGILLRPEETLPSRINQAEETLDSSQRLRAYNLGHPVLSLSKDILILDYAMAFEPDLIVWLITLQSFQRDQQLSPHLVRQNADRLQHLSERHNLNYAIDGISAHPNVLARSIVGQRRDLADWLRLQLFGLMWGITGIDQIYPDTIEPRTSDFDVDLSWASFPAPVKLETADLAFDILVAAHEIAGDTPILLVNEPIFISDGENSDLRYNLWYPRWAYDRYREIFLASSTIERWRFVDLWRLIERDEFTDSPVHLTPAGSQRLADRLSLEIRALIQRTQNDG